MAPAASLLLAAMPPDSAVHILDANAARLRAAGEPDVERLKDAVRQARESGYAVNALGEAPDIMSIGVAVQNAYGTPTGPLDLRPALSHRTAAGSADLALHASKAAIEARLQAAGP